MPEVICCLVEVGRDVDVRRADELDELLQADEAIVEDHVRFHALLLGQPLQRQPVRLTFVLEDVRMRGADDDVDGIRIAGHDRGQGRDDGFDPLVRREQAEAEQHGLALDAEEVLVEARIDERHVGYAVGNQVDLLRRHVIDRPAGTRRRARS